MLALVLQASLREEKKLRVENAKLKKEVEALKDQLVKTEKKNGGTFKSLLNIKFKLVLALKDLVI